MAPKQIMAPPNPISEKPARSAHSAKEKPNMIDQLVSDELAETKGCQYPGCENSIPGNSEFSYCEVCRALTLRNSISILLDPTSPINDRQGMIFDRAIHLMRPDDILNAVRKVEWIYLELQKQLNNAKLIEHRKQKFDDALASMRTEREKPKAPKAAAARENKKKKNREKLNDLLGGAENVRKILEEEKVDIDF